MRGQQNRGTGGMVAHDRVENERTRRRIDAAERLVEDIQLRVAAHDQKKLQFFLHTFGHGFDRLLGRQRKSLQHGVRLVPIEIGVEVREKLDRVQAPHPVGQIRFLRQIRDHRLRIRISGMAVDIRAAGVVLNQADQDLDQRRLAAAVRAEQTDDLSALEGERNVVQHQMAAVGLAEMFHFNKRHS